MTLRLARKVGKSGNFFWGCSNYPICKNTNKYERSDNYIDFVNGDFKLLLDSLKTKQDGEVVDIIYEIKVQMIAVLKHLTSCRWAAHLKTLYDELIKPNLTDQSVSDRVLRGGYNMN